MRPTCCSFRPTKPIRPTPRARCSTARRSYVFLAGKTAALGPVAEALRLAGYTGDFGASDGFYNTDTIDKYAKVLDGLRSSRRLPPLNRVPSAVQLLTDFEREVTQITAFSAYGYGAAQLSSRRLSARTHPPNRRS